MQSANRAEGDVDVIVKERFFRRQTSGVFVEVGAARPDYLSVSALYRSHGWQIIAIEPNPAYGDLHRAKGHEILEYACGDHDEDEVDFSVVDSHGEKYENGAVSFESFSSLAIKPNYATLKLDLDVTKIKVRLRRLDTILKEHAPDVDAIDIVCADVEGWELEVLKGLAFERYRPKVLIIENMFFERSYPRFMSERGYTLWRTIEFNEVYVRSDLLSAATRLRAKLEGLLTRGRRGLNRGRRKER